MDTASNQALRQLAQETANIVEPASPPVANFAAIGEQIATVLLRAAEDQVTEANNLLESTKVLVEGIRKQVAEQERLLAEVHVRMTTFGESILQAHKKYLDRSGQ
jgi:hypothetical protein